MVDAFVCDSVEADDIDMNENDLFDMPDETIKVNSNGPLVSENISRCSKCSKLETQRCKKWNV
jgi:hypothetical protein